MEFVQQNYPLILVGLAVLFIAAWLLLRPRQRVTLSDDTPVRPHMAVAKPKEGRGIAGEMAAAASDVAGQVLRAPVQEALQHGDCAADDFLQLKGVGPRLAGALNERGIWRFEQLASLEEDQARQLDDDLGQFRGRLARDRIIEQARFLAADDRAGFEARFGKL